MCPHTESFRCRCWVYHLLLRLKFQPAMASLQATFMGQGSNPTAVQRRETRQTAAPGIPTLTSAPGRRRKRMGARIAPLPESHEARTLATHTKRQRPLPSTVTQPQPVIAFQNGHNHLPSQECVQCSFHCQSG
jgi:hypothetical protein